MSYLGNELELLTENIHVLFSHLQGMILSKAKEVIEKEKIIKELKRIIIAGDFLDNDSESGEAGISGYFDSSDSESSLT